MVVLVCNILASSELCIAQCDQAPVSLSSRLFFMKTNLKCITEYDVMIARISFAPKLVLQGRIWLVEAWGPAE